MKTYGLYKGTELIMSRQERSCNLAILTIKGFLYGKLSAVRTVEELRNRQQNC